MLTEIDIQTVIVSILLSAITVHIAVNFQIKNFMKLLDKQTKEFLQEVKNNTLEIVNKTLNK